jgi:glycosyltransferase involved in cell wall biosynthesis
MNYNKKEIRSSILKFKKEDKIILFVGADRHYKGSNIVSRYANCNQDINIVVLTSNKNFEEKYQVLSKKCKIYHNANDNEKNYLLSLSRLLLFPSINKAESLGVILLEALYFGIPVIGFKINSGTTSLLKNNFNSYLVRLNDLKDFNKKTNLVYTNDTIHSKLSLNSRTYYEKNFTFSKQNFLDIYEK